jgi:two-component system chemotaxis sensor kinase CheA
MDEFEIELKNDFIEESEDLLTNAEESFLKLEEHGADPELLNSLFRVAHNIKGTSKAVGFDQVATVTHYAESLLLQLKEGTIEVNSSVVDVLFSFKDKIEEMIIGLKENLNAEFEIDKIVTQLKDATETSSTNDNAATDTVEALEEELDLMSDEDFEMEMASLSDNDCSAEGVDVVELESEEVSEAVIESLREFGFSDNEIMEKLGLSSLDIEKDSSVEVSTTGEPASSTGENVIPLSPVENKVKTCEAKKKSEPRSGSEDESIRVRLSKIDTINNIVGELVIMQTVLNQRRFIHIDDELSNSSISQMSKLLKEIQDLSMSLRMVPVKTTFQKMTRIVRDTSKALDKTIKLHLSGESTEVDKTVLEHLADPLVHMVRNSCDHGIESKEKRVSSGKDEVGNVELLAFHEGANLVIQITDDGGGIDPQIIRTKAIEKGVISENRQMTELETLQLIFHPGFSTKEEVSEVSGRGVGMDVVKNNIEKLGGEVKVMSKLGVGSSFKVILPLTLAIVDGIITTSNDEKFVIPLSQVNELTQISRNDIEEFTGGVELFRLRGEVLPLFYLNSKVGQRINKNSKEVVIVVKGTNYSFGVVVDDIIRQQQIVIKQIGEDIEEKEGIVGAAILGDGMPVFILDMFDLFQKNFSESQGYRKLMESNAA